jgi:hypothetical protein
MSKLAARASTIADEVSVLLEINAEGLPEGNGILVVFPGTTNAVTVAPRDLKRGSNKRLATLVADIYRRQALRK